MPTVVELCYCHAMKKPFSLLLFVLISFGYANAQLLPVPYPSAEAMQAVAAQLAETSPRAGVDAKNYVNTGCLKRLEDEGFVKKIWGK